MKRIATDPKRSHNVMTCNVIKLRISYFSEGMPPKTASMANKCFGGGSVVRIGLILISTELEDYELDDLANRLITITSKTFIPLPSYVE